MTPLATTTLLTPDAPAPEVHLHCVDLELSATTTELPVPADATGVRLLVRVHAVPVGYLTVTPEHCGDLPQLRRDAAAAYTAGIVEHLRADELSTSGDLVTATHGPCARVAQDESVTVVVCTRNRPEHVRRCLAVLREQAYGRFDVIVVDNAPDTDATEQVFAEVVGSDSRFGYLRLARPGLSHARNAGLAAATGTYVAFVDDDVRVDPLWLQFAVGAFAGRPAVACVTGLVASDTVAGAEQQYFDARVAWGERLRPHVYHPESDDPLHPWAAGRFGAGANMAFRRTSLAALGGFDEHLGVGTPARGGEDIDAFVRVLQSGADLAYEPAALVWHVHRSDSTDLERQLFGYGVGLTAFLAKQALRPATALRLARRVPRAIRHGLAVTRTPQRPGTDATSARRYRRIELAGMLLGPLYYLRSRRARSRARSQTTGGGRA